MKENITRRRKKGFILLHSQIFLHFLKSSSDDQCYRRKVIKTEVREKFECFPRVWFRYVDDIFAVFDTKPISLHNFVAKLNNRFPTIKFTYEMEHNEQLPFLDVLVIRNSENKLEFDVYRKEIATLRS
ncbi:hypothetical protein NQ318_001279 [Aromia moschata]|uniref:Reverse transcriptase domain-containing protein n=1 Tax=Aromia moschata TaxID=1265417 RepID=A0AAV8ZHL4_9CUCU|nr:hypothetical protein NQ318_001279 [Aromia moschata]